MKSDENRPKSDHIEELEQLRARVSHLEKEVSTLQKSETLLKNIFRAIPDLLTLHDRDLRVVLSNWHGHEYVSEEERAGYPHCYSVYMHRDEPCDSCHAEEVFETGQAKKLEKENPVDGIVREINVYPIFDADGKVEMVAEHIRDVTDRKQAARMQLQFSALVENAPFGIVHVERLGRIKFLNPTFTQILGYTLDDLPTVDKWFQRLYPDPGYRMQVMRAWEGDTENGNVEDVGTPVFKLTAKDGTEKMIEFRLVQLEDEEFLLTLDDVTEDQRIESELKDSRERYRKLFEAEQQKLTQLRVVNRVARNAASILDPRQLLQTSVLAIQKGFGYRTVAIMLLDEATKVLKCKAIAGKYSSFTQNGYEQSVDVGLMGWAAVTGESVLINDVSKDPRYSHGFDENFSVQSELCVPLKSAEQVLGVFDVQEIYLNAFNESDLMAMETLADQIVVALENARLYKQARQDAEAKVTLLREVNHRVNNNLAAIIGLLGIEQSRRVDNQAAFQTVMDDLNNRIRGLATVHRLLSSAQWAPLVLSELVLNITGSALQGLPSTKRIKVETAPSPVEISPNAANNLALIINELVTNAIKHAWPAQSTGSLTISIREELQTGEIALEFRDDGIGFPDEVLNMTTRNLGWELLQTLIERGIAGRFSLRNEQGAVVTIHFPASM